MKSKNSSANPVHKNTKKIRKKDKNGKKKRNRIAKTIASIKTEAKEEEWIEGVGSGTNPFAALLSPNLSSIPGRFKRDEKKFLRLTTVADKLFKGLRSLDLPLAITAVHQLSPALRKTSVVCPRPYSSFESGPLEEVLSPENFTALPAFVYPIEVVLSLEASGKWPQQQEAVKYLKTAFYFEISDKLRNESKIKTSVQPNHLDILYGGFVFRFSLLTQAEMSRGLKDPRDPSAPIAAECKLTSYLKSVSMSNKSFALACRLSKRWISAHLLRDYFSDNLVELILAECTPFRSAQEGFRKFLRILSTTDWLQNPLFVNFNEELTPEDTARLRESFIRKRPTMPPLCIYSPADLTGTIWSKSQPSVLILSRLKNLATTTLKALDTLALSPILSEEPALLCQLFHHSFDDYDAVISLHSRFISRNKETMSEESSEKGVSKEFPVVDFAPTSLYLDSLKDKCGSLALFFYDFYGGDKIGVVWKPQAKKPVEFKGIEVPGKKVNLKTGMLELDEDSVENIFLNLGQPIVKAVSFRKK